MNPSDEYQKIVEWSEEDGCFVGRCPDLFFEGVHDDDKAKVYKELCEVVQEWVELEEIESDPAFLKHIEKARRSLKAGKGIRIEDIEN